MGVSLAVSASPGGSPGTTAAARATLPRPLRLTILGKLGDQITASVLTTIWRIRPHRLTRKKQDLHASEHDRPGARSKRRSFLRKVRRIEPKPLILVETERSSVPERVGLDPAC